jgi:predicted acyl esterase
VRLEREGVKFSSYIVVKLQWSSAAASRSRKYISVAMREGARLSVGVYRPDVSGKYPVETRAEAE